MLDPTHTHTARLAAAGLLVFAVAGDAFAANAVAIQDFDGGSNVLNVGGSLTVSDWTNSKSAFADNPALSFSAWAHVGDWWSFQLTSVGTVRVSVTAQNTLANQYQPGFSLYASGANPFDGGTTGFLGEVSSAGWGTPHSFNAIGQMGAFGTAWMATGLGGNMQELLGYANAGEAHAAAETGWGENLLHGVHDMSITALFESGVSGSVAAGHAEMTLVDLQPGWYTLFIGGTDHSSSGGLFDVAVTAVPLPAGVWLLGSALAACGVVRRRVSA